MSRGPAIGAVGFPGRAVIDALRTVGDGTNFSRVSLHVDGVIVCTGEIDEINFVDGGLMLHGEAATPGTASADVHPELGHTAPGRWEEAVTALERRFTKAARGFLLRMVVEIDLTLEGGAGKGGKRLLKRRGDLQARLERIDGGR